MSIQQIEQSRVLRQYCANLGREKVAKRIIELAQEIIKQEGAYQSTLRNAGKIRALCVGAKTDSYWDEKQFLGYEDMYWEAKQNLENYNEKDDPKGTETLEELSNTAQAASEL